MSRTLHLGLFLLGLVSAQTPGKTPDVHPKLQTWKCTKSGGCIVQTSAVVLDALSHPVHQVSDTSLGCGVWGSAPNATVCPDEATCAKNCVMDGVTDYSSYGVTTSGGSLVMKMLSGSTVLSPRIYLLAPDQQNYELLQLTGGEFSFDVDVSKLPCGMNGALYFSEMAKDGGKSTLNTGGAAWGTGYCDAQCFTTPFINGVGNIAGKGSCCNELDIWEANARAEQVAPHVCNKSGLYECTGTECGSSGVCDKNGCGQNPYATNKNFYGPGLTVDTNKPFTVVTQFPATNGKLTEIRRLFIQNGKVIQNVGSTITDTYCSAGGTSMFETLGGVTAMGDSLARGMVLAMSIWWASSGFMNWLDSGTSGPCNATEGDPTIIQSKQPDTAVTFSQIKWGELNSTFV